MWSDEEKIPACDQICGNCSHYDADNARELPIYRAGKVYDYKEFAPCMCVSIDEYTFLMKGKYAECECDGFEPSDEYLEIRREAAKQEEEAEETKRDLNRYLYYQGNVGNW